MVPPLTIIAVLLIAQNPSPLEVGKVLKGQVKSSSSEIHTQALAKKKSPAPTLGVTYSLSVSSAGVYCIELMSYDFDAYLVVRDASGEVISENDNGYMNNHSRVVGRLKARHKYEVVACSLRGRGEFRMIAKKGRPEQLSRKRKLENSIADLQDQIQYLEKKHGKESKEVATALTDLAKLHRGASNYEKALEYSQRSLDIRIKVFGEVHVMTAFSLANIGSLYRRAAQFENALVYLERSLLIREELLGHAHKDTATNLNELGLVLRRLSRYHEARTRYEDALAIIRVEFGETHLRTAAVLNNLAILLQEQGNYEEAKLHYEQALKIREESENTDPKDLAFSLVGLANLFQMLGQAQNALDFNMRALELRERELGVDHLDTASSLVSVAALLKIQGNYEESLSYYERALQIQRKRLNGANPMLAVTLTGIAHLYQVRGSYEEARAYYQEAVEIRRKSTNDKNPGTGTCISNLADFYEFRGEYAKALPLYEEALAIRESAFPPGHPKIANTLNSLARLLKASGKKTEALAMAQRSLAMRRKVHGDRHPGTASALSNVASIYSSSGDHQTAQEMMREALQIREQVFGPEHPYTAMNLSNLARVLYAAGEFGEAFDLQARALVSSLNFLDRELPSLGEAERLRLIHGKSHPAGLLECLQHLPEHSLVDAYAIFLRWKGKATRLQMAGLKLSQVSSSPEISRKKGQMQVLAKELSNLILMPLAQQSEDHAKTIEELRSKRLRLERELNRELNLGELIASPSLASVQAGLSDGEVLLDFFVDQNAYAWALTSTGEPRLIALGSGPELRTAMNEYLQNYAVRGGRAVAATGANSSSHLFNLLWKPLQEVVADAGKVFISPDGFLGELPFGVLALPDQSYLLEKHQFVYLSDPSGLAREVVERQGMEGSLLAAGGVNYFRRDDVSSDVFVSETRSSPLRSSWSSLPGTSEELQTLRDLHEHVLGWKSPLNVLEGEAATEERIRQELPGKRYIHIATHGYFEPDHLPSLILDATEKHAEAEIESQVGAVGLLPGLLSGLVFAGVNGDPDPTRDDGYLSAEEIQHLDLSACDLVVLSACETALGSSRSGEGLMSLRRAFEVAGADTVISSLWKVNDRVTAEMMKDFYINLWQKKMSRGDALHEAKLRTLRRNRIEQGGDAMPSTWGAFVLSGDWN